MTPALLQTWSTLQMIQEGLLSLQAKVFAQSTG